MLQVSGVATLGTALFMSFLTGLIDKNKSTFSPMPTFTLLSDVQVKRQKPLKNAFQIFGIGLVLLLGWSSPVLGATINVPADHGTIGGAVAAASNGDIIIVAAGNYTETISVSKDLEFRGANFGIDPNTGMRVAETVLLDCDIDILGANTVVLDGFQIHQTNTTTPISLGGGTIATVRYCIIERFGTVAGSTVRGIEISNGAGSKNIKNNKFTGDASGGLFSSHVTWNSGMFINGPASTIAIEANVFEKCRTALNIDDMGTGITFSGNTVRNCGTFMSFGGTTPTTGSYTFGSNEFNTLVSTFINLSNVAVSFRLDISAGTYGGVAFSALSLANLFGIESTMFHRGRSGRNGLVTYVTNNQYVVPANANIQLAIDYANIGHIINIQDGSYNQRLTVSKSLTLDGQSETGTILTGTGLPGTGSGIFINTGITGVTIKDLTVKNYAGSAPGTHAGIWANQNNDDLMVENVTIKDNVGGSGFYANGIGSGVDNVTLNNLDVSGHTAVNGVARGIVIWNGLKSNITITNCDVYNNNCCGIELQDGTASGVTMSGNNVHDNEDNGMSAIGLNGSVGNNVISNNTVTNCGRFGIEIKNPDGSTLVSGNMVDGPTTTPTNPTNALRDFAGIAVHRRGNTGGPDVPTGVSVIGNTVTDYVQPSTSDGFGIVIEGTYHTVTNNTLTGCDVGIQLQKGHLPLPPSDGDQNNLADQYFGRGNSQTTECNSVYDNSFSMNGVDERSVGGPFNAGFVTNDNTNLNYCTIQAAVDAASPGDKLIVSPGTYAENVTINKSLTLEGANAGLTCDDPMRGAESVVSPASGVPFTVTADGVTINGFEITGAACANAIECGNTSDLNIQFNNIHDIGTTVNGSHVHAINYTVNNSPASTENVLIADNCFDNIGNFSNHQRSTSAIGILQSTSTGTLTDLTIERNTISNIKAKNVDWTLGGRIANGITINVGGNANFLLNGKVVNALIRENEISNLEGFIATGIGLEGNTENATIENNTVANLTGYKNDTRANGGRDLSGLKFENNKYVNTCTIENNSFQTNTFTNNGTPNLGYAISNYVTDANGGVATLSCNWMGTSVYADILDNVGMTGKVFAKAGCTINFVPFLVNGTDNSSSNVGFQPIPGSCTGGPVKVYNGNTFVSAHDAIQEAIDAATTLNGYSIRVASGTYNENVDAATPNKNVRILPGNSPGCVTINGNYTLNIGDVLEMELEGLTACSQHDKLIVNGAVSLGQATLSLPATMFLIEDGDQVMIIENDGADPVTGMFKQGNFATDGQNQYYIDYKGGDGNDVVLTKCCGALIDLGVFTTTVGTPAGQKLVIKAKPNKDAVYGAYSQGTFTLRTLSANGVADFVPANVQSDFGYLQIGTKQTSGGYDYFIFNFEALPDTADLKNWTAGSEHNLATIAYNCTIGNATFELINDAFAISKGGEFYQELNGETNPGAQGVFYNTSATGPTVVSITATSNSPVCQTMEIDLSSTTSNGSPSYSYVWNGPDSYSNTVADPAPFTADLVDAGVYNVTVTDGNGCTATASTTVIVPATGNCVKNENTVKYYPTINQAIDAVLTLNGHTLTVPAGTWAEDVVVDKELTINGPKVGVSGCDPGRGTGEAVVVPATNAVGLGEIFHVEASNVTIDGFTIDGDNTLLTSGVTNPTGADMNAAEGVTLYVDNKSSLKVRNNIFQNLSYFGVTLFGASFNAPATSGHEVTNNKFQKLGTYNDPEPNPNLNVNFWGGGVLLYNSQYTNVKDNCMENVRIGVQTGNFAKVNPGATVYQEIDNNTIAARRRGIFHNLHYSAASGLTLKNNDITAVVNANETVWDGILLSSLSVPSTSQDNTIDGTAVSNPSEGYEVWNVKNTFPTAISGGTVTGVGTGLFVNNYDGYNSNAGDGAHATVTNLAITPKASGTGIRLYDNPSSTGANVQLQIGTGVTVTNGTKGLVVERPSASIVGGTLNNIAFTGQSGNYIELISNTGNLDGMSATYAGTTGAMKSLTDNFATEDKILHKVDNLALGLVRVKAGEIFVTPNSGSVQRGVDASTVGDIVNVANGTYNEDVNVNKDITVDGESHAAIIRGLYAAGLGHSVLMSASNATIKDLKVTRDYGATLTDWYNCPKNQGLTIGNGTTGVTVDNVWIADNRNGLYINNAQSFTVQNCIIEDNRTGIQLVNNISGGQIKNNFIRDNFTLGVLYNVFSGTQLIGTNHELNDNDISGNWYAQLAFHQTGGTLGDLTGFDQNCNWYGTVTPDYAAIPAGEPGYNSQVPSQFAGVDPGLTADIRGTQAHLLNYIPFTTIGTDNAPATDGFQPVPGSCNGLGPVVNQTQNLTYPTIQLAVDEADPGDIIYAPAGTYSENVVIALPLTLKGDNEMNPGCGTRAAESVISGGGGTAVTITSNGVSLLGFKLVGHTGVSSTGFTDIVIKNNKAEVQVFGIASTAMTTSGTDEYTIQDNCVDLLCAGYETFPFNANPTLSPTQLAGAWYTDRYAPNGFVSASFGGGNRLKHSINAADTQGDPFYNTQGRKYDITGTQAMSIQLYVPSSFGSSSRRMAGFWGTAVNNSNVVTGYPILEFTSDGGVPRFRGWNSNGSGSWVDLGLPTGFAYDQWYTLNIALNGSNTVYNVGDLELIIPSPAGTASISNVILQGYNHAPGLTYDIYWDNLNTYCSPAATANMPTVGVTVAAASGTDDVTLQGNGISDAFYGYLLYAVNTTPRTTVTGGTYTNLLQGVAVVNTVDGVTYAPSTVGVSNVSMTSFSGDYPAMPAANFHSGIYAFTGGSNAANNVDMLLNNVTVKNTGKTAPNSAGLHFADFSTGAGNRLNAVVNESTIEDNKNRGVQVRGANATATVNTSSILNNGADPHGTGGNDGFGVYAGVGATVTLLNNFIANPASQVGYTVTALFEGVAPAATIVATDNSILRNGNGTLASTTTGLIDADCNWWGDANPNVFDEFILGNVTYAPYYNNGTDNNLVSAGFQPSVPCIGLTDFYVNDNSTAGDLITDAVGLDAPGTRGTKHRPYRHINNAIGAATSGVGHTVRVDIGNYNDEQVLVNKGLTILGTTGAPAARPLVDFTGTVSGKPTLFDVSADGVTIDNIGFNVDMAKLRSAIIVSGATIDNVVIKDNDIDAYGTPAGSYGDQNAVSVNYGGSTNYRVAAGGVNSVTFTGNNVSGSLPLAFFRSGISADEVGGTFNNNVLQTINHDVLVRFASNGNVTVSGNTFNGGGLELAEHNAGAGTFTVSNNTFDGTFANSAAAGTAVFRLKNNQQNKATSVTGNTLSNAQWGMSVENYKNLTVDDNTFTPLAGSTDFLHVGINTKLINSNSNTNLQTQINGTFTNNVFNGSGVAGGTAIGFFNHDSDNDDIGTFTIGTNGNENEFKANIATFARLDDQLGSTDPATFPTDYPNTGSWPTTMACWDKDVDLTHNKFDIGTGLEKPLDMTHAERNTLETKLYHKPDNACLGRFFQPVEVMAKVYLQGPYDTPSNKMNDALRLLSDFPLAEPHTQINIDFPNSFVKVNNSVTETITAAVRDNADTDNAIVDWIWLELRDKNNSNTVLFTRSALLQRDGDVVDLDGASEVAFPDSYQDDYFLMVRHRNHLGAMTATAIDFTAPPLVGFTDPNQATFGTTPTSARRLVETNVYGLWAGNTFPRTTSGNFNLMYNGSSNDRLPILNRVGVSTPLNVVTGYYLEDVNMNGQVKYNGSNNDRVIILNNVGPSTPLNIITQEPNN